MLRKITLKLLKLYYPIRYRANLNCHGNVKFGKDVIINTYDKKNFVAIGVNTKIGNRVTLNANGLYIKIGNNCFIDDNALLKLWGGKIEIGNQVYINSYTVLNGHGGLKIGNNVLIAMHVSIIPSNHIFTNLKETINKQGNVNKGIVIEDDVWIGANVVILDGVTIGKGAIIGAGSIVNKSIEPYSIVVGNPAKKIKERK